MLCRFYQCFSSCTICSTLAFCLLGVLGVLSCLQAITSTRKGNKKLAIYDLKITMRWEAQAEDDEQQV